MDTQSQQPRFEAIARALEDAPPGTVLDVGCGDGVLSKYLPPTLSYVGVETSPIACREAQIRGLRVFHDTAEYFPSTIQHVRFSAIVMSEMLYYTADPCGPLDRYSRFLAQGGVFVLAVYRESAQHGSIRRHLRSLLDRRHPSSEAQCTTMIHDFIAASGWQIRRRIPIAILEPNGSSALGYFTERAAFLLICSIPRERLLMLRPDIVSASEIEAYAVR